MKFDKIAKQIIQENSVVNEISSWKRWELGQEWEQEQKVANRNKELEESGTWYIRLDGKIHKDKSGQPAAYNGLRHAQNVWKKLVVYPSFQNKKIVKFTMKPVDVPSEYPQQGQTPPAA
jgi:hypothetical protein